jgi:hypothetical protein
MYNATGSGSIFTPDISNLLGKGVKRSSAAVFQFELI